jgi:biliverdin reductase
LTLGLVGTGFAADLRAQALLADGRSRLVAVTGRQPHRTEAFARRYGAAARGHWTDLIGDPQIDGVVVCHANAHHAEVITAALAAHQSVIAEYPLALALGPATQILHLAKTKGLHLHVGHIELFTGAHQALGQYLPMLGRPRYARYATMSPKSPAPTRWTYCPELFGFPLVGALSRLHRLVDSFGPVDRVYCRNTYGDRYTGEDGLEYYRSCLCVAQLSFGNGLQAEVVYGKGEGIGVEQRRLEVMGEQGQIILDGDQGQLLGPAGAQPLVIGPRRGLFAQDTALALDQVILGSPLYDQAEASVYSLAVATAAQQSAQTGGSVAVSARFPKLTRQ